MLFPLPSSSMYKIDKPLSDRINLLKFLSIVMVVYIHTGSDGSACPDPMGLHIIEDFFRFFMYMVTQSIARTAVPLFFLISAVLLFAKDISWTHNIRKKCNTVLLPYLFWNSFWIMICFTAQTIPSISGIFPRDSYYIRGYTTLDWLKAYTYLNGNYPYLYTLWFLRDLFLMNLCFPFIKKAVDRAPRMMLLIITVFWICNINVTFLDCQTIVFFIAGYYIVKYNLDIRRVDHIPWKIVIIPYSIFLLLDYIFRSSFPAIHSITILIGIVFFIKLSGSLIHRKISEILLRLSKYSFIIYAFHEMNLSLIKKVLSILLPSSLLVQVAELIILPFAIILECILFGIIFKKLFPKLYFLTTGNRG